MHVGLHAVVQALDVERVEALFHHGLEGQGEYGFAQVQGLPHEGMPAALNNVGAALQQPQKAFFALAHEDNVVLLPFGTVVSEDVAGLARGGAQKVHQFAVGGIALVHEHMAVIARVERKHAVAQNGRGHARLVLWQHRRRIE